jgi:hypothetical protein
MEMTSQLPVLFFHIRKTAGTSVKHFLYHQFRAQDCRLDVHDLRQEDVDWGRYALVTGHVDYDFRQHYRQPPFQVTCLRDPIDRTLSQFYYHQSAFLQTEFRNRQGDLALPLSQILESLRRVSSYGDIRDYLRQQPEIARDLLADHQVRCLAGSAAVKAYRGQPERLLACAREHLETCEAVLLSTRLPDTLALLCRDLGWDCPEDIPHDNPTVGRPTLANHDPELLATLAELNPLDTELYRFAEQLVERRLRRLRSSPARLPGRDDLPSAADFTFDQPIRGSGWHIRERGADAWYCWTNREASLHLSLSGTGDHVLRCQVAHAACEEAWRGLEVSVNGNRLEVKAPAASPPCVLEARVPAGLLGRLPGRVRFGFRVPQTVCPWERDPTNPDRRQLGVAVSRLQMQPCHAPVAFSFTRTLARLGRRWFSRAGATPGT